MGVAPAARRPKYASTGEDSDLAELAARVAAEGGGKISAEVSRELALDIVLNEIVEQACAMTGASGAAIALRREGEMVCRASSGEKRAAIGHTAEHKIGTWREFCVRSRARVQWCDDALADGRADGEASRQMGVRSVVVQPILGEGIAGEREVIGIIEIFSPQAGAFGERDQRTLEILAGRTIRSVEARRRAQSSGASTLPAPTLARDEAAAPLVDEYEADAVTARGFDWFASVMGAIIVLVALVMGAMVGMRVGWIKGYSLGRAAGGTEISPAKSQSGSTALPPSGSSSSSTTSSLTSSPAVSSPDTSMVNANESLKANPAGGQTQNVDGRNLDGRSEAAENGPIPAGGLRVYENGREIFRMQNGKAIAMKAGLQTRSDAGSEVVRRVEPKYPEQALAQHLQGPVVLDVHISKEGAVQDAKVVSGNPVLAEAAVEAVRQWSFKPRMQDGHTVEMETEITLNFTLPTR